MSQSRMFPDAPAHAVGLPGAEAVNAKGDSRESIRAVDIAPRVRKPAPPAPRMHCFEFRALLQAQRQTLLARFNEPVTASDDGGAGATTGMATTAIRDKHELLHIEAALARIAAGTYGICSACGGEIGRARLKAEPAAQRCEPCRIPVLAALAN